MPNKIEETYDIDEGLFDRIADKISGTSAKYGQLATNFSAFMRGDKESISDPDQAKNIKMLERNIDRMKKDFESMIKDLATDLTAAVGVPDDGPFKKVVDDFDDAVQTMRTALNNLSIKADDADDKLLPSAGETVTEDPPEADTDDTGDVDLPPFSNPWTKPGEEEMINENMLKLWEKIIK